VPSQPASGERWLRQRHWLALAAVLLAIAMLLPPVIGLARRQAYAEALQFVVFATVVPALLVTGAPWRLSRAGRAAGTGLADRVARSRSRHPALPRAGGYLLAYVAVIITWRLPVVVDAMARHPALLAAEVMTLVTVGCCFWIELVPSPPLLPRLSRPQRAAAAAIPMWTIWALAYIMGFSQANWFAAYHHVAGQGLSAAADQQIATGIMWAVPACCFPPVIYACLIRWLRDSADPDDELPALAVGRDPESAHRSRRPPRGWRAPSA
jgi:cytochrome c oxidase assembly factor CtaG